MPNQIDVVRVGARIRSPHEFWTAFDRTQLDRLKGLHYSEQRFEEFAAKVSEIARNAFRATPISSHPNGPGWFAEAKWNIPLFAGAFCPSHSAFDLMDAIAGAVCLRHEWALQGPALLREFGVPQFSARGLTIIVHLEPKEEPIDSNLKLDHEMLTKLCDEADSVGEPEQTVVALSEQCRSRLQLHSARFLPEPLNQDAGPELKLYPLNQAEVESAIGRTESGFFFSNKGLADVRGNGLCPGKDKDAPIYTGKVDTETLKLWISRSRRRIDILQTYIPQVPDLIAQLSNALNNGVQIRVLLQMPRWTRERFLDLVPKELLVPEQSMPGQAAQAQRAAQQKKALFESPFAALRGRQLGADHQRFMRDIEGCADTLQDLKQAYASRKTHNKGGIDIRFYATTPVFVLHRFDSTMFVGFFLKDALAVAAPHFVIVGDGQPIFKTFEAEYESVWQDKKNTTQAFL